MTRTRWLLIAALVASSNVAAAQVVDSGRPVRPMRGAPGQPRGRGGPPPDRRALEERVQRAIANTIQRELNLDGQKMRQLQQANSKYEDERRTLLREERDARETLREAIKDSTSSDQSRIETALSRLIQIQRRRVDLLEQEQKELAAFLTPRQRAQFFSLRERMARRLLELEQGGGGRRGPPR